MSAFPSVNITDPLRRLARERPDSVAFVRPRGAKITLRELDRRVDDLARRCLAVGVTPGQLVLLAVRAPLRLLQLELALARIGAAGASPLIDRSLVSARLIDGASSPTPGPGRHFIDTWFEGAPVDGAPVASHEDPNAVAIVCAAAGTVGTPDAIPITHAQLAARIDAANVGVPLPALPRQICMPSPATGFGLVTMLRVLHAGGTLIASSTAEEVVAAVERFHVNRITMLPAWIDSLVAALPARGNPLAALEEIEVGGATMPPPLFRLARERLCERLYAIYATTETGFIAAGRMDELDLEHGETGRVLPGIEVEACSADGAALPRGAEGRLRVRGATCVDRYLDALPSAGTFRDGWVVLPDLGRVAPDGTLSLAGRANDVINVGGYEVNPTTIENALLSLEFVEDAAAFGMPAPNGIQQLCAAIVLKAPIDRATLETRLRERLPRIAPALVMQVKSIPRSEGGEIQRQELASMALASAARAH